MEVKTLFRITLLAATSLAAGAAHATEYRIVDLGGVAQAGERVYAQALSDNGHVAGALTGQRSSDGFVWTQADGVTTIGSLGGSRAMAFDVNSRGQAAGYATDSRGLSRAILHDRSQGIIDLGTLGGRRSVGRAVNGRGDVAGYAEESRGYNRAFLFTQSGGMEDLGTLGGQTSFANGINDNGDAVGVAERADRSRRAFIYRSGLEMEMLDTLGGNFAVANAINNQGAVVGASQLANGQMRGFVYTPATGMQELGTLGGVFSYAYSVNDNGDVVGSAGIPGYASRAALWRDGAVQDLNDSLPADSGWVLVNAYDINNHGDIQGAGYYQGEWRSFLLVATGGPGQPPETGQVLYDVVLLDQLNDVSDVNDAGQVVGRISGAFTADGRHHAAVWFNGSVTDLGLIGCRESVTYCESNGFDINGLGQVAGHSHKSSGLAPYSPQAVAAFDTTLVSIPTLGVEESRAVAINDLGHVAGYGRDTYCDPVCDYQTKAFWWSGSGDAVSLGTLGGLRSYAAAMTNSGHVVGHSDTASGETHAYLWADNVMRDLGTLGGDYSAATTANDTGAVVGSSEAAEGAYHAFVWRDGEGMMDLGPFTPVDVDDHGAIVGHQDGRAVLWDDGTLTDLNEVIDPASGWELWEAKGMNNLGAIVGEGNQGMFMLVPRNRPGVPGVPAPIPRLR